MKTKAFLLAFLLLVSFLANAQRTSVKDRVSFTVDKIDEALKLDKEKRAVIEDIFTSFYADQERLRNDLQKPTGLAQGLNRQDFQSVRKKNEALINARDNSLKKELTAEEYKKWKSEIEPSLQKSRRKK